MPKTLHKAQTDFEEAAKNEDKDALDEVVDANLGDQEKRSAKRRWSLIELFVKLTAFILIETTLCFIFFYALVTNRPKRRNKRLDKWDVNGTITLEDPYDGKNQGWPSLPGVSTVLSIIGGALTFLLVFSLGWTCARRVLSFERVANHHICPAQPAGSSAGGARARSWAGRSRRSSISTFM